MRRKNMQDLGGRPLIAWTVDAAQDCELVTRTVVSTEDVEIATWCKRNWVETVPQPLDSALSGTMSAPVVLSALDFLRDGEGYEPRYVCLLHPTSPFRTSGHLRSAIDQCQKVNGISIISFTGDDLNGALYVSDAERFRRNGTFFAPLIWPYTMDEVTGLDVDTWDDLDQAREYVAWPGAAVLRGLLS